MKKLFLLALSTAFFISCSNDNHVDTITDDSSATIQQKYHELFRDYDKFKLDGQTITDENQIITALKNAAVSDFHPSDKEVNFYSSDQKLKELTNVNMQKIRNKIVSEKELIDSRGKVYYEDEDSFISEDQVVNGKSSIEGISGLGTIASDSFFTDFANNIYFITEYFNNNNTHYFSKATNNSNMWDYNFRSARARASGVVSSNFSMGRVFDRMYREGNDEVFNQGKVNIKVKNDGDENDMKLIFYSGTSYNGSTTIISLDIDQVVTIGRYKFSSFTNNYPLSMKVLTDHEYYSGDW